MWYENIQYNKSMPLKVLLVGTEHSGEHWHSAIEIILVLKGVINITVEGESQLVSAGEMLLINSNCCHCSDGVNGENLHIVFQINPDFFIGYYEEFNHYIKFSPDVQTEVNKNVYETIRSCAARIVLEYKDKKDAYEIAVIGLLNEMLASIIRYYPHYVRYDHRNLLKDENMRRLDRIMSYVDENFTEELKITELASKERLSVTYFSHFIKNYIGMPLRDYIITKRIDRAKYLILSSNKSIAQISVECGFSDYQSFSKLFKKRVECAPSDYREIYMSGHIGSEELSNITYKYSWDLAGHTLQDLNTNLGYVFGSWDVPIDWDVLTTEVEPYLVIKPLNL